MKSLPNLIIFSALVAVVSCGKNNVSGKGPNNSIQTCIAYSSPGQCSQYSNPLVMPSNYNSQGVSLDQVQRENPCIYSTTNGQTNLMRTQQVIPINMPTIVTNGDMYVGVTSYGDVAAIIGNGTARPTFVSYLCPRPVSGQGTLMPQITIGAYTNCSVKYITAANMVFPDGSQANFRALSPGGSSARQKFSFCQQ